MSITVRLWSKADLARIGKDMKLTTIFMNGHTFSEEEMEHYPYHLRKTYNVYLAPLKGSVLTNDEGFFLAEEEPVTVYATSPAMARWFVSQEYRGEITGMDEVITKIKPVKYTASKKSGGKGKSRKSGSSLGAIR
jgi:hypothetical protein